MRSKERQRAYRLANLEKFRAWQRQYYDRNRTKENARTATFDRLNPDKAAARTEKYRAKYPEKRKAWTRNRYLSNRETYRMYSRNRKARKLGAGGSFTAQQWKELKLLYNNRCLRCGKHEDEIPLTPDHIRPLSRGGCNFISNIQPLCLPCNQTKGIKDTDYRPVHTPAGDP